MKTKQNPEEEKQNKVLSKENPELVKYAAFMQKNFEEIHILNFELYKKSGSSNVSVDKQLETIIPNPGKILKWIAYARHSAAMHNPLSILGLEIIEAGMYKFQRLYTDLVTNAQKMNEVYELEYQKLWKEYQNLKSEMEDTNIRSEQINEKYNEMSDLKETLRKEIADKFEKGLQGKKKYYQILNGIKLGYKTQKHPHYDIIAKIVKEILIEHESLLMKQIEEKEKAEEEKSEEDGEKEQTEQIEESDVEESDSEIESD